MGIIFLKLKKSFRECNRDIKISGKKRPADI